MYEELEYEFSEFKRDFDEGNLSFKRYFDKDDYEDEYSHNQIDKFQTKFIERVKEYLHEKSPNKYVVASGWCVFVMTAEEAKKRKVMRILPSFIDRQAYLIMNGLSNRLTRLLIDGKHLMMPLTKS